jgi:HAD superfamily hydrolase (TIGR01509 family)
VPDVDLVIFDCDGVLVDSEPISGRVLAAALTGAGLPTTPAEARRRYQGLQLADVAARAETELADAGLPDGWLAAFVEDRAAVFRRELRPVAGAATAVEQVKAAGIGVCVASQAGHEKMRLTLGLTGLARLFPDKALFSATSVPRGKPFPDLFLHAAATMGVDPGRCVVVEDSSSGVAAALAAGMRAVVYTADPPGQEPPDPAARPLEALAGLPALLGIA